ncbi:hypothetical protein ACOME3_000650 [Neoechinorhynchus agilis]
MLDLLDARKDELSRSRVVSFDFVSLYSNVDNQAALIMLEIEDVMVLTRLVLECNPVSIQKPAIQASPWSRDGQLPSSHISLHFP